MWAPDYVSIEELAAYVRVGDSVDDAVLHLAVATASRMIDQACSRQFGKVDTPTARYYTARWNTTRCAWWVPVDDLSTTVDLSVAADTVGEGDYDDVLTAITCEPRNAAADGRPYTELWVRPSATVQPAGYADGVRVTARWGWPGIPDAIRQACLLQASRLLSRRDSPHGVAGSPETGGELRLLARLDPDVQTSVRPYRKVWGAV